MLKVSKVLLLINVVSSIMIPYLSYCIPDVSKIYMCVSTLSLILFLMIKRKIELNSSIIPCILYYSILLIGTVCNSGDIKGLITECILVFNTIFILFNIKKKDFGSHLRSIGILLFIICIINFITIIAFPQGLYNHGLERNYYFLGHVNISIRFLLPGVCFLLISDYLNNNKISKLTIINIGFVLLTLVITWSATAILGYLVFLFIIFYLKINYNVVKLLLPTRTFIVIMFVTYLIIFMRVQYYFERFFQLVLKRDASFTNRTIIWDYAIKNIHDKPLIGWGRTFEQTRRIILRGTSAHNQFLNILFEGGIFLLLFFMIWVLFMAKGIKKCTNKKVTSVLLAALTSYLIMWIAEPFSYSGVVLMFIIFIMIMKSPELFNENEVDT